MAKVRLDDVAVEARETWNQDRKDVPVVGLEHLEPDEIWLRQWNVNPDENTFTKGFKKGQLLFGRRRAYQKKMSLAPCDGICSGDVTVIAARPEKIVPELLPYYLRTDAFFDFAMRGSGGSLSPRVKWSHISDYEFDLPPMDEQKKLAELLWAANDLKESYKKAITATDEMLKAKFREMFGDAGDDSSRGGAEARSKWPVVELQSACSTFIDGDWIEAKDQSEKGIRLVQTGNVGVGAFICKDDKSRWISEQTFTRLSCTEVFAGDILISRLPDPIGRACILPHGLGRAITAVDCTIVRLKNTILPKFLIAVTDSTSYRKQIEQATAGTTRARVSRGSLGRIRIPLPPLSLQREFVAIADKAESAKANLKKSIAAIDQVMKGLING